MNSTAIATVQLNLIQHNHACLRGLLPGKKILTMIKSNAYGHGLIFVAKALSETDAFGVATIAEALQLRAAGIQKDIVVMRGFMTTDELSLFFSDSHLIACAHDDQQLKILNSTKDESRALRLWLKIDTGMHRLGFDCARFDDVYSTINALPFVDKSFVVCSHLADADNSDPTFTKNQIERFKAATKNVNNEKSLLNSAGILAYPEAAYDWIRPGLMLYGVSPFSHKSPRIFDFQPAMTLSSKLISVKNIVRGEKIGYSCAFTADRDMRIGVIGMGYGDSYPRQAKNGTPVLIRGMRCPIVGRVSMDMITVDVSHIPDVAVDDTAILWGADLSVGEIAACMNTVPHELLCHLTGRVQVKY